MAVVDASVLVAAAVDTGPEGAWAEEILKGQLAAPHLVHVEATDVLRRLEIGGRVTSLEATSAQRDLRRLDIEPYSYAPFAERIWELRGNVSSYDAWYVALAEALGVHLATLDRRLANGAGPECSFLLPDQGGRGRPPVEVTFLPARSREELRHQCAHRRVVPVGAPPGAPDGW